MSFYEELSKYYDVIFPTSQATVNFLEERVVASSKILDMACGTGNYSIKLSELGHQVYGIDLDDRMIDMANAKSKSKGLTTSYLSGDMRDVGDIFTNGEYNLVFCIGNSLVHLQTTDEIEKLLEDIYRIIDINGKLVIQIINYDRILKYKIDHLPDINRQEKGVRFIRKYDYKSEENKIYFNTEIIVEDSNGARSFTNSIPLLPLQSFELVEILEKVGFSDIKLYGNFNGGEYSLESYPTIVVASV